MKKIILIVILLFSIFTFSQIDRNIGRNQYNNSSSKSKTKKVNLTEKTLDFFKKEIKVDAFQEAVIKNLLNDYEVNAIKINTSEATDFEKKANLFY
jgi:hypothetical protein